MIYLNIMLLLLPHILPSFIYLDQDIFFTFVFMKHFQKSFKSKKLLFQTPFLNFEQTEKFLKANKAIA